MRVLVVEDDEGIAAGLQSHLARQGWAVDVCDSVARGWAALCAEAFDLVQAGRCTIATYLRGLGLEVR